MRIDPWAELDHPLGVRVGEGRQPVHAHAGRELLVPWVAFPTITTVWFPPPCEGVAGAARAVAEATAASSDTDRAAIMEARMDG